MAVTLGGFVAAGAAASQLFEQRFAPNHVSHLASLGIDLEDPVRVEGRVISNPVRSSYGLQFDLEAERAESRGIEHWICGKVRLRLVTSDDPESVALAENLRLAYGARIRVLARLREPRLYQNPGSFDFRRRMESIEDVCYVGTIKSPRLIENLPESRGPSLRAFNQTLRTHLLRSIDKLYLPWAAEGRTGAVLKAVLLGDRSALDSDTVENFRRTGLYHLLVIAGLHVGLLAMLVSLLLRTLGLRETWRSIGVLLFLLSYAALVEQRAPTLRATLMIVLYLLGRFLYRPQPGLNAVGLAALILLLARPAWLFESGFQLSFSAALIICALAVPLVENGPGLLRRALWELPETGRDPGLPPRLAQFRSETRMAVEWLKSHAAILSRHPALATKIVVIPMQVAIWTTSAILFSAVLQFGLLLPMAETFHRVTFVGIALNALAIPIMTAVLAVAVPTVLLAAISPALALWPGKLLGLIMTGMFALTDLPGLPGWLSFRVPEPPGWVSLGFAFAMVVAAWALGRRRRIFWAALAALMLFGGLISLHPFPSRLPEQSLEITALDCGGGDSILVILPNRITMLVDGCGTRTTSAREAAYGGRRWDPGEDIVSPYLWSRGISTLDVVALSHAHQDHLGGLAAVLRNFRVGEFWHGRNPLTPAYSALFGEAKRQHIPERQLEAGERLELGESTVEVLWPPREREIAASPSNDDSLVMRVSTAEAAVLLVGDISDVVEKELLAKGAPLKSQVLKVAHHGARGSSSPEFLAQVSPAAALVTGESSGLVNLPSPEALERLHAAGARVLRTDIDGASTVALQGHKLAIDTRGTVRVD